MVIMTFVETGLVAIPMINRRIPLKSVLEIHCLEAFASVFADLQDQQLLTPLVNLYGQNSA